MRRFGLIYAAGLVALLLSACAPLEPSQDEALPQDPRYRDWFRAVVQCSGVGGRYDRIRWWVLADDSPNAGETWGRRDVYLKRRYATSAYVVKHEILHTLIGDEFHLQPAWHVCGVWRP